MWASGGLSFICLLLEILVLGLLVLELTDSAWWVAITGVMRISPFLFFGMFSGYIADRMDRWHVMVLVRVSFVLTTAILLLLIVTDRIETWHILVGSLAQGWGLVLDVPSRHSFIYDLVGPQRVVSAWSLETINFTLGMTLGPLTGGLLVQYTGFSGAYILLLSLYVLVLLLISRVKSRIPRLSTSSQRMWRSLASGLRYSVRNRAILGVLVLTLIMNAMAFSAFPLFPVVARDHLHVGPGLTGVLISALGLGLFFGAIFISFFGTVSYHGRIFVVGSILLLAGLGLFALSPWYPLSFLFLLLAGVGFCGFQIMQSPIILMSAGPEMRGLVMGVLVLSIGSGPFGLLEMGALATLMNAQAAIVINAVLGLVLVIPVMILTPLVWRPIAVAAGNEAVSAHGRRSSDHTQQS